MPDESTLIAICAAREGVSPTEYWHTRTPAEFKSSVLAWMETYVMPLRMWSASRKDEGGNAARGRPGRSAGRAAAASPRSRDGVYQQLIDTARRMGGPMRGKVRTNVVDLARIMPTDRAMTPEERHRMRLQLGRSFKRDAVPMDRPAPA